MHEPAIQNELDDYLDILGQQPFLKSFTQICSCFPVADASSHSAIVNTLTNGLERLSASFPWLAGQVVNEGSGQGSSGIFKLKPLEKIPRLIVKDLRQDASTPTMDDLRRANFPFSMLDESIIAPRKTLPGSSDEFASDVAPVFLLQANFITGGLILTFVGQHNTMDMTGQGQIIHLFSKACHNEQFTSQELSSGNLDRRNLVTLLDDSYKPGSELVHNMVKPTPSHPISGGTNDHPALPPVPKCTWTYFSLHPTSLTALKSLATKTIAPGTSYISTDDAISAFIWQCIMRARLPRLSPTAETTFGRAVNVRHFLDIPLTYPGLMQNMTYHTYTIQKLLEEPLGWIASELRSALNPQTSNLGYHTRALATVFDRTPDKSTLSFTASIDPSVDIMFSSWSHLDCYKLDFKLGLGKPEAVRRPQFDPVECLIYLIPKTLDGEIAVAICLRDDDMVRLRVDDEFVKYASYIG